MTMRNWYDFAAVHRDNIRSARIRFKGDIDHNDMYQHKIGDEVVLGISQSDKDVSHFIDARILAVRFSMNVNYDIVVPIGNSGVLAVLKRIPGENLRNPNRVFDEPSAPYIETEIEESKETVTLAEELFPEPIELSSEPIADSFFGHQLTNGLPKEHFVKIDGVFLDGMQFVNCDYQIGDKVKISHEGKDLIGTIYEIYVGSHIAYDVAVPTENGYHAILRDISPDFFDGVENV